MKGFLKKDDYRLRFSPADKNIKVDLLVIGGGLEGLLTAYLASQCEIRVAVCERRFVAGGRTAFVSGCLTPDRTASDATKKYAEAAEIITNAATEAGLSVTPLPFYFFSEKRLSVPKGARLFCGEELSVFSGTAPDGFFLPNGALTFSATDFCKALAEKCRLSGVQIFERTEIVSVSERSATTDTGVEIAFRSRINATGRGENGKRRFLVRGEFRAEKLPKLAFGDGERCPLTAFSENGRTLCATVSARTEIGAFIEKRRLEESLSDLLGVSFLSRKIRTGECRGEVSVSAICEKCLRRKADGFGLDR